MGMRVDELEGDHNDPLRWQGYAKISSRISYAWLDANKRAGRYVILENTNTKQNQHIYTYLLSMLAHSFFSLHVYGDLSKFIS